MLACVVAGCAPSTTATVIDIPASRGAYLPGAAIASGDPPTVLGRWVGVGSQESGGSWEMVVDVVAHTPGLCARVVYPTLPCSTEWICTEGTGRRALRARERVTEGHDACIDGGELTMTLASDGRAAWAWSGSGEVARAVLSRRRAPP